MNSGCRRAPQLRAQELLVVLFCSGVGLSKHLQGYRSCEKLCTRPSLRLPSSAHHLYHLFQKMTLDREVLKRFYSSDVLFHCC